MPALFDKVTLIGIGLIGSSIARVIKRDKIARHLVAVAKSKKTIDTVFQITTDDGSDPALCEYDIHANKGNSCRIGTKYADITTSVGPTGYIELSVEDDKIVSVRIDIANNGGQFYMCVNLKSAFGGGCTCREFEIF